MSERRFLGISVLLAVGVVGWGPSAFAQDAVLSGLPQSFLQQLRPGVAIEQLIAQALQPIRQIDTNDDGLDVADIDLRQSVNDANVRASQAAQVLRADLDGDGTVTLAEIRRLTAAELSRKDIDPEAQEGQKATDRREQEFLKFDQNADQSITFQEMIVLPEQSNRRSREFDQYRELLKSDPDGDGHLTVTEMEGIARKAFAAIDTDGNGEISRREFGLRQDVIMAAMEYTSAPPCTIPAPAVADLVAVVGMYHGDAQSTLAVNGQDDVTHVSRVKIEAGEGKIYLVMGAYVPTIWKVEGAVERISRAVVIPRSRNEASASEIWAGAAVMGLAKETVTFAKPGACGGYFSEVGSKDAQRVQRSITKGIGRAPDKMIGVYDAEGVSVPGGVVMKPSKERDVIITGGNTIIATEGEGPTVLEGGLTLQAQENWLANEGGVIEIAASDVVAPGKVAPYEVIPGQDGLRLLVQQGILERTPKGYRVIKPLTRWPAGLAGAHSVTFILPKGMPEPEGSLGHSRIIYEE